MHAIHWLIGSFSVPVTIVIYSVLKYAVPFLVESSVMQRTLCAEVLLKKETYLEQVGDT